MNTNNSLRSLKSEKRLESLWDLPQKFSVAAKLINFGTWLARLFMKSWRSMALFVKAFAKFSWSRICEMQALDKAAFTFNIALPPLLSMASVEDAVWLGKEKGEEFCTLNPKSHEKWTFFVCLEVFFRVLPSQGTWGFKAVVTKENIFFSTSSSLGTAFTNKICEEEIVYSSESQRSMYRIQIPT